MEPKKIYQLQLTQVDGEAVENATFTLHTESGAEQAIESVYQGSHGVYYLDLTAVKEKADIKVQAANFSEQRLSFDPQKGIPRPEVVLFSGKKKTLLINGKITPFRINKKLAKWQGTSSEPMALKAVRERLKGRGVDTDEDDQQMQRAIPLDRLKAADRDQLKTEMEEADEGTLLVGAIEGAQEPLFPSGRIFVQLAKGASRADLEKFLQRRKASIIGDFPTIEGFFELLAEDRQADKVVKLVQKLEQADWVEEASIEFDQELELEMALLPSDLIRPAQWHLKICRLPDAWQRLQNHSPGNAYGSADVILGYSDSGIETTGGGNVRHPDLRDTVNGGILTAFLGGNNNKVYYMYGFRHNIPPPPAAPALMTNHNDAFVGTHGMAVVGLGSGDTDGTNGGVGIASNSRLISLILPRQASNTLFSHFVDFASGMAPEWAADNINYNSTQVFPVPFNRGGNGGPAAHVLNCSHSLPMGPNAAMTAAYTRATHFGRNRRGLLILTSAGNGDRNTRTSNLWGNEVNVMKVSSSTLDHRLREMAAAFTDFAVGTNFSIDFCTPSRSNQRRVNDPPRLHALVTHSQVGAGSAIGNRGTVAPVQNLPLAVGDTVVKLTPGDFGNFPTGTSIVLQETGNIEHTDIANITSVDPGRKEVTLDRRIQYRYTGATNIITGALDYRETFGGTSGSAPQASAIAALLLAANPNLTWIEAREIMRRTAQPIALKYVGVNRDKRWVEITGGVPTDLVTADGVLDIRGPFTTTNSGLIAGRDTITVVSTNNFRPRQAVLIGGESTLHAAGAAAGDSTITVVRTDEFEQNDLIFIGKDCETILESNVAAGAGTIRVVNPDGFAVGDQLNITGDFVRITAINHVSGGGASDARILFSIAYMGPSGSLPAKSAGDLVVIRNTQAEGPLTITNKAGNVLTVSPVLRNPYGGNTKVYISGTETRVVREVLSATRLRIDPLVNNHPIVNIAGDIKVVGGRRADYNYGLGFGRLDADAAVAAAIAYNHSQRDLRIRNFLADNGVNNMASKPTHSPDLWITHNAASPAGLVYADEPPHQNPKTDISAPIFDGSGTNDLTVSGSYSGAAAATYIVEIADDSTNPDKYKVFKDGVELVAATDIAVGAMVIGDNISVTFAAVDGHTVGDKWHIQAESVANRFAHVRVQNRGTLASFRSAGVGASLPAAQSRLLLCMSNGFPTVEFVGTGTNDLTVHSAYTGATTSFYTIRISNASVTPNTYQIAPDAGAWSAAAPLPAAGTNILVGDGVNVQFGNNSGYTLNDFWVIRCHTVANSWVNIDHFLIKQNVPTFSLTTNRPGTWIMQEQPISGLAAGADDYTNNATWAENNRPPRNGPGVALPTHPLRLFLLGEVTPHDGPQAGDSPDANNNFSYRELVFARLGFHKGSGMEPMPRFFEVDSFGTVLNSNFNVRVLIDAGTVRVESIKIEMEMTFENGTVESEVFAYNGASWAFGGGGAAWASMNAPVIMSTGAVASGEQWEIQFNGILNLDRNQSKVKITPKIYSSINPFVVLEKGEQSIPIYEQAELPSQRYKSVTPADLAPKSHFFCQHNLLTQTAALAYGPVTGNEANQYRATALFNASAEPKAYAVVDGIVMVQRDPANTKVVNLILKPFRQAMLGFTPVRYFIYRGIKLTDILKGTSSGDEKLMRNQSGASTFVDMLWQLHTAQNGAVPFESKALGYDPGNQAGNILLDNYFYRSDPDFQLPFVSRGTHLANFLHDDGGNPYDFGFEIVLEEGDFQLDMNYVRKTSHLIDVTGMPSGTNAQKLNLRLKREEVLRYIDPAAFFGMHNSEKGWLMVDDGLGGQGKLTGDDIHVKVIKKFHTQNTLYVDVRNENGLSYNFYGKYDDGTANKFALSMGSTAAGIADQKYETHSWPILLVNRPSAANANAYNEVHLRFRKDYNKKPILYIDHGRPLTSVTKGQFIADADLYPAGALTNVIGFRYPNRDLGAGNREGTAWLIKLHYGLRIDSTNPSPPEVPKTDAYLDNLFGPLNLDANLKWAGSFDFSWLTAQDRKFVDASAIGFEHQVDRGIAITEAALPNGRLIFYAVAKSVFSNSNAAFVPTNGLTGGVSKKGSFFQEAQLVGGYNLYFDTLDIGGNKVTSLQLQEQAPPKGKPLDGMMILGISKQEYTTLKSLPGFEAKYPRNVQLQADASNPFSDANGKSYTKYKLGVRGLDANGLAKTSFPMVDIIVYSVDGGLFFFSDAFSADEPMPSAYLRNYEEGLGVKKRPPRNFSIKAVNQGVKQFLIGGIDLTKEIFIDDTVTVKNSGNSKQNDGNYTVTAVNFNGTDTEVTVQQAIPGNPATRGDLHQMEQTYEDFLIKKDTLGVLSGLHPMKKLVKDFIDAVAIAPNTPAGLSNLESAVNTFAPKILDRARKACANASMVDADDRPLYWGRLKMLVALKSHPFLLQSLGDRNRLVKLLESKSRGYESVNFSGAGAAKKVLVTGFDPFSLGANPYQSNPSGAAVLALHGKSLPGFANVYVEAPIFPVRYRDFDDDNVVENFMRRYIDNNHPRHVAVDMIMTMSQGGVLEFWIDRFAARYRGALADNENKPPVSLLASFRFPADLVGDEFYWTSLPVAKINPSANGGRTFPIYYNSAFEYQWTDVGGATKTAEVLPKENNILIPKGHLADTNLPIENAGHPHNSVLGSNKVPSDLNAGTKPKFSEIRSRQGSGANYLSNEIYYRTKRLQDELGKFVDSGHFHLPQLQAVSTLRKHGQTTTKDFSQTKTKAMIDQLITAIGNANS